MSKRLIKRLARSWPLRGLQSLALGVLVTAAAAAAGGASPPAATVTVRHVLWDANQKPLYERCARDFEAQQPGVRVRIEQLGWDDYWPALSTGFISGTAPDVFTNHASRFSEFALNGVMAPLSPLMARDAVDGGVYEDGLLALWQYQGGQYALPSDWDTIALVVNLEHLRAAGVPLAALQQLDWNPRDGGSLGRLMARLTVDEQGRRLGEPGFDAQRVRVYGYQNPGSGGLMGQSEWSHFAVSAGWRYQDRPWDGALRFGDPAFVDTLAWLASLPARGVSATPAALGRLGADAAFQAGRVAMVPSGSWMVGHFQRHARFAHAWVPLPVGPGGQRASMRNGLGLSLWSGSRQPRAAWQWVRYAGSRACQARIAEAGVIYPAIRGLAEVAVAAQRARGVDASAFLAAARGPTFAPPVVPRAAEVNDLMTSVLERVLSGRARAAEALPEAARRVRELTRDP